MRDRTVRLSSTAFRPLPMTRSCFRVIRTIQAGGRVFATVALVERDGQKAILKDFSRTPWLFRSTIGTFLTAREARAYRRLQTVQGVPRLVKRVGRHGLLLECVEGKNCLESPEHDFCQNFFDQASVLLAAVRARGVLHLDVAGNLILGLDRRPWLVDFGACLLLPCWSGRLGRRLAELRRKYDERALLKLKRRRAPRLLMGTEAEESRAVLPFEGLIRVAERFLRRAVERIAKDPSSAREH